MIIRRLMTGMFESNSYILGDGSEGAVIDAGVDADEIIEVLNQEKLNLKYIILTHAHIDHIASLDELREITGALVLIHEKENKALASPKYNGSGLFGQQRQFKAADRLLKDGDVIELGSEKLTVIHTPGHTSGGICIKAGNAVFTGDTLFRLSVGRTDLGDGNFEVLIDSIMNKLMTLDDDTIVYPGHGPESTIGFERKNNFYL